MILISSIIRSNYRFTFSSKKSMFLRLYIYICGLDNYPVSQFELNKSEQVVGGTNRFRPNFHSKEFEIEGNGTFCSKFANLLKLVSPYLFPGRTIEKLGSSSATFPKCRWKFSSPFPKTSVFPSNHRCFISTYVDPFDHLTPPPPSFN